MKNKDGIVFRVTGLYEEPGRRKRAETWSLIRMLSSHNTLPWCLIGDMNNVLSQTDKQGGRPYPRQLIQGFRYVIEDCSLSDMDLIGYPFTWERGSGTTDRIEVRLDRDLVSIGFMNKFPEAKLYNLEISTSDHCPILLELYNSKVEFQVKRFRFENAWLREPMCQQIIEEVWSSGMNRSFYEKLKACSEILSSWGKEITGVSRTEFINVREQLKS